PYTNPVGMYTPRPGHDGESDFSEEEIYSALYNSLYKIKVDTSIINSQKANCVYSKLGGNRRFQELIYEFDNSSLNLTFKLGNLNGENGNCSSSPPYNDVVITLDRKKLESRRTIEGARTFLHEAIHAQIFALLRRIGGHENLSADNFPELFDDYVDYKNGNLPASQLHHSYMAAKYVELIAEGLSEFDTANQNNPEINLDHYRALAWGGLEKTKAFNNLSQEQKDKIYLDRDFIVSWHSTIACQ
ncbi:MAG: hypothetical protein ACKO96_20580, partial [Flammeovirgaceae bacterium]